MCYEIVVFDGDYGFLSNFYETPIKYKGLVYGSSEAAYQAMKCDDKCEYVLFTELGPMDSKKLGRKIKMRGDWKDIRLNIMYEIVQAKFKQNKEIAKLLANTGNSHIEEGNYWGDMFWGTYNREGRNELGKILMTIRSEILNKNEHCFKCNEMEIT